MAFRQTVNFLKQDNYKWELRNFEIKLKSSYAVKKTSEANTLLLLSTVGDEALRVDNNL